MFSPRPKPVWRQAKKYKVPTIAFVNKMDRTGANFFKVVDDMHKKLGASVVPMVIPIGAESEFSGLIDVLTEKAYSFTGDEGQNVTEIPVPANLADLLKEKHNYLIECVAEVDESVMEVFLNDQGALPMRWSRKPSARLSLPAHSFPAYCGTAFKNKGVQLLLDAVITYLPSPCGYTGKPAA